MSNGKWIYVIFMILMITSHTLVDNDTSTDELHKLKDYKPPKDKICYNIHGGSIEINNTILSYTVAMGRTKKRVLLITIDLYVYDVPADCFDPTRNIVYFKYLSTPMKDKYPVLYHNPIFKKIKNNMNIWIMYDSDGDWICMTTNDSKQAINYNVDTSKIYKGFALSGEGPEILIATQEPCKCYSLQKREDKENTITGSGTALWLTAYKCKNGDRIINSNGIEKVTDFRLLCFDHDDSYIFMVEGTKCDSKNTVEWPLASGFVSDGIFVLIGFPDNYIFSENVFTQKGKKIKRTIVANEDFYKCAGIIPPKKFLLDNCRNGVINYNNKQCICCT
uniref:Uncharacterized protein LOC113794413 n=1 Tax=Dermatophagoides pteronyssinus TaxID=6956 RepID=A0A6P6Y5Q2_DERPT|nr:uncharacterized protein LOC113794413 [Dermatophagoides pteronyssinus]